MSAETGSDSALQNYKADRGVSVFDLPAFKSSESLPIAFNRVEIVERYLIDSVTKKKRKFKYLDEINDEGRVIRSTLYIPAQSDLGRRPGAVRRDDDKNRKRDD